jgi:hypothetical protein
MDDLLVILLLLGFTLASLGLVRLLERLRGRDGR